MWIYPSCVFSFSTWYKKIPIPHFTFCQINLFSFEMRDTTEGKTLAQTYSSLSTKTRKKFHKVKNLFFASLSSSFLDLNSFPSHARTFHPYCTHNTSYSKTCFTKHAMHTRHYISVSPTIQVNQTGTCFYCLHWASREYRP